MNRYATVGLSVLAGAALVEASLIPGIVIGGAAVLVPRYLPGLRRRLQPALGSLARRRTAPRPAQPDQPGVSQSPAAPGGLAIKQALAKTITFRIIVTSLDFTSNYLVIGDLATAAGLSTFALVAGPVFYFVHETVWNYYSGPSGTSVGLPALPLLRPDAETGQEERTISRALAKTITYRTIATVMDFTTNYVVTGNLAAAAGLSAFGFVVGPFVYIGHEMAWDYYTRPASARVT
jgi:uncharacterized membrane protein